MFLLLRRKEALKRISGGATLFLTELDTFLLQKLNEFVNCILGYPKPKARFSFTPEKVSKCSTSEFLTS